MDIWGPARKSSLSGNQYFLVLIDDYTRYTWVLFLKHKYDALSVFKIWRKQVQRDSGEKLRCIRTDEASELLSKYFTQFLQFHGIRHETSAAHEHQLNGVAERKLRTLTECARTLLKSHDIHNCFWAEAINTATYLVNRLPTNAVPDCVPYEAWTGDKPYLDHLRIFGSTAYVYVSEQGRKQGKMSAHSFPSIFVGYCDTKNAYKLLEPTSRRIFNRRSVDFNEEDFQLARKGVAFGRVVYISDSDSDDEFSQLQPHQSRLLNPDDQHHSFDDPLPLPSSTSSPPSYSNHLPAVSSSAEIPVNDQPPSTSAEPNTIICPRSSTSEAPFASSSTIDLSQPPGVLDHGSLQTRFFKPSDVTTINIILHLHVLAPFMNPLRLKKLLRART